MACLAHVEFSFRALESQSSNPGADMPVQETVMMCVMSEALKPSNWFIASRASGKE